MTGLGNVLPATFMATYAAVSFKDLNKPTGQDQTKELDKQCKINVILCEDKEALHRQLKEGERQKAKHMAKMDLLETKNEALKDRVYEQQERMMPASFWANYTAVSLKDLDKPTRQE